MLPYYKLPTEKVYIKKKEARILYGLINNFQIIFKKILSEKIDVKKNG
jgi:hypothetical protein